MRKEALEQLEWHRKRGDHIVIVSASIDLYLRPWCEQHKVDLICSTMEHTSGIYSGRYLQGDCSFEEKSKRIQAALNLKDYTDIFAYGDTPEDKNLLGLATVPVYQWEYFPR
jgi:HAD superfamily phosphoserine phosphatase-like hydrolase